MEAVNLLKIYREKMQEQNEPDLKHKIRRKMFQKYEALLGKGASGPTWLKEEKIARIVQEALHYFDDKDYDLYAYCIMPNHVHVVFKHLNRGGGNSPKNDYQIMKILHSIKSYSALECNRVLKRSGAFWQSESYDRVIRDRNELESTIRYTLNNPVKAKLVDYWEEWPYTYCRPEFRESFM